MISRRCGPDPNSDAAAQKASVYPLNYHGFKLQEYHNKLIDVTLIDGAPLSLLIERFIIIGMVHVTRGFWL